MVGEIVITREGRQLMESAVSGKIILPSYLMQLANALLALDRWDTYVEECVTPLILSSLEEKGYIMEATGLEQAEEVLFENRRRRL